MCMRDENDDDRYSIAGNLVVSQAAIVVSLARRDLCALIDLRLVVRPGCAVPATKRADGINEKVITRRRAV